MLIDIGEMDWKQLREQKQTLLKVVGTSIPSEESDLTGILNLVDHIQDEAAKQLSEEEVFGKREQS